MPEVDRIRWMVVPEAAAAKAALYSGQVHLLYTLLPSDLEELKASPGVTVHQVEGLGWAALLLQTRDPLLKDVRLRRAIAHAVNLDRAVQASAAGLARPNPSVVPRSSP